MPLISYPLNDYDKEQVRQFVNYFGEIWPESHYGPMHILVSDYNLLDHNLAFCRGFAQAMLSGDEVYVTESGSRVVLGEYEPHDKTELRASLLFLDLLALIPEEKRDIHSEGVEEDRR